MAESAEVSRRQQTSAEVSRRQQGADGGLPKPDTFPLDEDQTTTSLEDVIKKYQKLETEELQKQLSEMRNFLVRGSRLKISRTRFESDLAIQATLLRINAIIAVLEEREIENP